MTFPSMMVMFSTKTTEDNYTMQVYCVIGGFNYEGEHFGSLKLFDCKSTAEEYQNHLKDEGTYDYVMMEIKSINLESKIAS